MNTALEVTDLCIDYRNLSHISIHQLFNGRKKKENTLDVIHAVKDVTFSVERGEILGIIGSNGSGKSTMLKAIGGIFKPDFGRIDTKGHRVSLMSIGVGFKGEITGRENILTSGMLLGFSPQYIQERMEKIIDFSELKEYIDIPVKRYSSGMYSKLAFAITAVLDTDIMLVDEVLSVGDAWFRKKSFDKMQELISDADRTVLIVSHDMQTLRKVCKRVMWLQSGQIKDIGDTDTVLEEYCDFVGVDWKGIIK